MPSLSTQTLTPTPVTPERARATSAAWALSPSLTTDPWAEPARAAEVPRALASWASTRWARCCFAASVRLPVRLPGAAVRLPGAAVATRATSGHEATAANAPIGTEARTVRSRTDA